MASHDNEQLRDEDFGVPFCILGRRTSLRDPDTCKWLLGDSKGRVRPIDRFDITVWHNGKYVAASQAEFENLKELARKAQTHKLSRGGGTESNGELQRTVSIKLPNGASFSGSKSQISNNRLLFKFAKRQCGIENCFDIVPGAIITFSTNRFSIKIEFPDSFRGKYQNSEYQRAIVTLFKEQPSTKVKLSRKADKSQGVSRKTIAVRLSELVDSKGVFLNDPELEQVFNSYKSSTSASKTNRAKASRSQIEDSARWFLVLRINAPSKGESSWTCELCAGDQNDESVVIGFDDPSFQSLSQFDQKDLFHFLQRSKNELTHLWAPLERIRPTETKATLGIAELELLLSATVTEFIKDNVRVQFPRELIQAGDKRLIKLIQVNDDLPAKPAQSSANEILRFKSKLALDDIPLSEEELRELAAVRESLVQIRGKWIYIDSFHRQELTQLLFKCSENENVSYSFDEAFREYWFDELLTASGVKSIPAEVSLEVPAEFREAVANIRNINPPAVAIPADLSATLRDYQHAGLNWLAMLSSYGLGGCLADDMGLGKTIQTIAWLLHLSEKGITEPALLICPTSVMMNWEKEIKKFAPSLRTYLHHGPTRSNNDLDFFKATRHKNLVITSFNLLTRDQELFRRVSWKWSAVILDEAQKIKNHETKQSEAARSLSLFATHRLALTGTPVENGPRDLWPIMDFLNPGMLGTIQQYVTNIAAPVEQNHSSQHRAELRKKISPFILRRMKTDKEIAPELPEKIEKRHRCFLTREQAGWYQAAINNAKSALNSSDQGERQGAILKVLPELKQICNGVAALQKDGSKIDTRSGKIQTLRDELLKVITVGEKAIIFSQYPNQFDEIEDFLMDEFNNGIGKSLNGFAIGAQSLTLTGKDEIREREEKQDKFQNDPRFPVMLISLKAGGTGLNLQAANHVFHLDRWWNAAVEDQATDRAWRIGQDKTVLDHKLICYGTFEERIDEIIQKKKKLSVDLLGDVDEDTVCHELSAMPNDELSDLLSLNESEAICEE